MRKYLCLVLLLCTSYFAIAQKNYEFDYVLEYKYTNADTLKKTRLGYKFINSKDNSFVFTVWEAKDVYKMMLTLANGTYYFGEIVKEDFFVEVISLKCPYTGYDKNSENIKDYEFRRLPDTLINTERLSHFVVNPLNEKEIKKNKLVPLHYIIDNKYNFNFPVLRPSDLLYKMWQKKLNLPNGVIKEIYSNIGEHTLFTELIQCVKVKKMIIIDTKCK